MAEVPSTMPTARSATRRMISSVLNAAAAITFCSSMIESRRWGLGSGPDVSAIAVTIHGWPGYSSVVAPRLQARPGPFDGADSSRCRELEVVGAQAGRPGEVARLGGQRATPGERAVDPREQLVTDDLGAQRMGVSRRERGHRCGLVRGLHLRVAIGAALLVRALAGVALDRDIELRFRIEPPHHVDDVATVLRAELEAELAAVLAVRERTRGSPRRP